MPASFTRRDKRKFLSLFLTITFITNTLFPFIVWFVWYLGIAKLIVIKDEYRKYIDNKIDLEFI